MSTNRLASLLVAGSLAAFTQGAFAQNPGRYAERAAERAEERIEMRYRADKEACERRNRDRQDICEERAKGRRDVALAEHEYNLRPTRENARRRELARVKAAFEVAKERCDRLSGREENRCERQAEARFDRETARIERQPERR